MQSVTWSGHETITKNPTLAQFFGAMNDPENAMVAVHNAPPVGAVIAGRTVTDDNRAQLYLATKGVWRWK